MNPAPVIAAMSSPGSAPVPGGSKALAEVTKSPKGPGSAPVPGGSKAAKQFKAIAAMSLNRVIGQGDRIPWHLPEDFKWFKRMTVGQIVVMGRKTFQSIGKPLPNRTTLVLSRHAFQFPGVQTISDLSQVDPARETRDVFICGGAQVYELALPLCSELYLTLVKRVVEGDVFFPKFEDRFELSEQVADHADFEIRRYFASATFASPTSTFCPPPV